VLTKTVGLAERGGAVTGENEKDARNQALFREVNERIEQLAMGSDGGHDSYICECGNPRCAEPMKLTPAEYEALRKHANRFAVLPDHVNPAVETVVEQRGRYSVVETLADEASRIARETDPRSHTNQSTRRA
jgi:hypothetical protein